MIDLFCGAGGLTLGLHRAGFKTLLAIDNDRHACQTVRSNLSVTVHEGSLEDLSHDELSKLASSRPGDLTLICGGPPCQGFSVQRRGPLRDQRNKLVGQFIETAVAFKPTFILMENVPTLLGSRGDAYMKAVYSLLHDRGYEYAAEILEAADYGVPQQRRRAFLVAWREDRVKCFDFPRATHRPDSWNTVRTAISDLPEPPEDCTEHPRFANHTRVRISSVNQRRIGYVPEGGGRKDIPRELQLPCHRNDNGHRHLDVYGRMWWDRPAPTITAMFDNFTRGRFAHPSKNRVITGREGARLQTFPDSYRFFGGKKDVARQIGNAVPPQLAQDLGAALIRALSGKVEFRSERSRQTNLSLG